MIGMFVSTRQRYWYRGGIAVLAALVAWVATYLLTPELQADAPAIFFPLAVICSAYLTGPVGGLLSTLLSALLAAYFFLPPQGFAVDRLEDEVRLVVFVFLGGAISLFAQALQQSRLRIKAKSQALSESEDRLRMATEAADVGIWYWDVQADQLIWSDKCKVLFGLATAARVTFATFLDAVHPEDRPLVAKAYGQAFACQGDCDIEYRAVHPDGTVRWILAKGHGACDERGRPVRMHGIAMDITSRKQVMEQLRLLNETLEHRVAERTAVAEQRTRQVQTLACELTRAEQRERKRLAEILHDHLQQLLVGARFSISVLQSQVQGADLLAPVRQVDDLLVQSLEVTRTLTAELSPPGLNEGGLVQGMQWLADWMRDKHGLQVDLRVDRQPGPPSGDVTLLLFQSVRELLFNIVKHAHANRAEVAISRSDDQRICIVVQDNGIGFDPAQLRPHGKPGSGFGLASVRERLELLDGRLEVSSAPGQGTRITLQAPLPLPDGHLADSV